MRAFQIGDAVTVHDGDRDDVIYTGKIVRITPTGRIALDGERVPRWNGDGTARGQGIYNGRRLRLVFP